MRKLAVILHADVAGSTALVQRNEALAHERIRDAFHRFSASIKAYGGTTRERRGDALVAEFSRASDAVCAALHFQQSNTDHNARLDDGIAPAIRVGIALGEEIFADDTVTGAGVVLAQRLEQLAQSGGVVIQAAASETVPRRMPFEYQSLGEQNVKGFDQPVRAFSVSVRSGESVPAPESPRPAARASSQRLWISGAVATLVVAIAGVLGWWQPWRPQVEPARIEHKAFPLPDKPSLVVLPFDNLSDDPQQEYFAVGFTEDMITDLSKLSDLLVIARHSSFAYKDKAMDVRAIARELGVRHVLEGSVRRVGDRLRLNAQLIDADTGSHVWAQRFDRPLSDILTVQDEIRHEIVTALDVKLSEGEQARFWRKSSTKPEVYDLFIRARQRRNSFTPEGVDEAIRLAEQAVALDPTFAGGWLALGHALNIAAFQGWTDSPDEALDRAIEAAERAIELDPSLGEAHTLLGMVVMKRAEYERALRELEEGVALTPNSAQSVMLLGTFLPGYGRPREALEMVERAFRLDPSPPSWYFDPLAYAHFALGNHADAVTAVSECITRIPDYLWCRVLATMIHMAAGEEGPARAQAQEVLRINPDFSSTNARRQVAMAEQREREIALLRQAGLPE